MKTRIHVHAHSLVFFALLMLAGCDSASTDTELLDEETATDVAMTVALAVSEEDGGVADQLEDVVTLANEMALSKQPGAHATVMGSTPVYNEATGTWNVDISRERTTSNGLRSMSYQRSYEYQFRDADGQPQQFFTVDSTNAKTIIFRILSGSGEYSSPEVVSTLNVLTADWTVDNADEDIFTVSGTYQRNASSIIERTLVTRTMEHSVTLNRLEINVPRGGALRSFTGTLSGDYEAMRYTSVENEERNVEVSVSVDITIDENQVIIDIDRDRFISTLDTGDLIQ